eukprot:200513-Prorocentrum_minimum.AAC.2
MSYCEAPPPAALAPPAEKGLRFGHVLLEVHVEDLFALLFGGGGELHEVVHPVQHGGVQVVGPVGHQNQKKALGLRPYSRSKQRAR